MIYCMNCGTQLKKDALFCTQCGTKIEVGVVVNTVSTPLITPQIETPDNFVSAPPIKPMPSKNKWLQMALYIGCSLLVVYLITLFYFPGAMILFFLAVPPVGLNYIAWKFNNKYISLIAGIFYIFTIFGIPATILCIIAFVTFNKRISIQ